MTEAEILPSAEEVRAELPEEEKEKFDNVMTWKTRIVSFLLTHMEEVKDKFMIIKDRCDANWNKSQHQMRSGSAPICRFCPAWNHYEKNCYIRDMLRRMK